MSNRISYPKLFRIENCIWQIFPPRKLSHHYKQTLYHQLQKVTEERRFRATCLGRFLWDPALQKETGRKREVFPSPRKRTWIDHFCQRQTIGDEKSIYLARTLPQSHSEPKSGSAQFSQGPLGGKVMEGRDYWGARPPHPPYPGIHFGENLHIHMILTCPFFFARGQLVRCCIACLLQPKNGLTNAWHNFLTKRKLRRPKNC